MAAMTKLAIRADVHAVLKARSVATGVPMVRLIETLLNVPPAPRVVDRPAPLREALTRLVTKDPDPDTIHAVSHLLRRLPA